MHLNPLTLELALTAYLVSLAVFIPISGWMADHFGSRRIFRCSILVFLLGSVLCALSLSMAALVLARFIQGMGDVLLAARYLPDLKEEAPHLAGCRG